MSQNWLGNAESTSENISKISMIGLENTNNHYIDDNGIVTALIYTDPSDGVSASSLSIDSIKLTIKIRISVPDFLESMIAAYCGDLGNKNIKFTKVGEV